MQKELITGTSSDEDLKSALVKYGGGQFVHIVRSILEKLKSITAVSEAVHGPLFEKLLTGLI